MKSLLSACSIICLLSVSGCALTHQTSSEQANIEDQHFLSVSQDGEFRFLENRDLTPTKKFNLIFNGIDEFLEKKRRRYLSCNGKKEKESFNLYTWRIK